MATTTPTQGTLTWNVDAAHSSIGFSVRHMGIFTVRGNLGAVSGTAETTDGVLSKVNLTIDTTGINTNNSQRDTHLKSADFLNTDQNPNITYESTSIEKKSDSEYTITGNLSIAGQTKPVTATIEIVPPVKDPWGNTRAGATGSGKLYRKDWGITYNAVLETGNLMVADEVNFTVDVQATLAA